jgi:hypothetical protein
MKDGGAETSPLSAKGLYSGKIADAHSDKWSFAHMKIAEDGTVHGIVMEGDEAYHIDPAMVHFDSPQEADHVVRCLLAALSYWCCSHT